MKDRKKIAFVGNPNVGKSSIFNKLTGLRQHTGNWSGKTVDVMEGEMKGCEKYTLIDLPGTYSLIPKSKEEKVTRDFLAFENPDKTVIVCDGTCLERNLSLAIQTMEMVDNVIICINLMDQAKKKSIIISAKKLEKILGVKVVTVSATTGEGIEDLVGAIEREENVSYKIKYNPILEKAVEGLEKELLCILNPSINPRWLATKILSGDKETLEKISRDIKVDILREENIIKAKKDARVFLSLKGISEEEIDEIMITTVIKEGEEIARECVTYLCVDYDKTDRKIDKLLTSKITGIPIMLSLLFLVFYLTITFANYPSQMLGNFFESLKTPIENFIISIHTPKIIVDILINGVYTVVTFIIAVMLPPMAIFFPLFTLLEDLGFLPRVAFNLDKYFKKAGACGKQALCMCMGFGCNAAGVSGCRIIDSKRERLLAMITNNFVPCNGRFPTIIAIISMFFVLASGTFSSLYASLILSIIICFSILITLVISGILSKTILKGEPSSFILELPPYRKPKIIPVVVRSIIDRTLKVLARAVVVALPAGFIIWLMGNIMIGDINLLRYTANFIDPVARYIGLDGVILIAFIFALPANEIFFPIMLMAYLNIGVVEDISNLSHLREILIINGWSIKTGICTILFSLMHWPCATTLLTIFKESGSRKWTILSFIIPTITAIILCFSVNLIFEIFI